MAASSGCGGSRPTASTAAGSGHFEEAELVAGLEGLARLAEESIVALAPVAAQYGEAASDEPERLRTALFPAPRPGPFGLLRDLQALKVLAADVHAANTAVSQAAKALRDPGLMAGCGFAEERIRRQQAWLHTQILHRSAHTLTVPG